MPNLKADSIIGSAVSKNGPAQFIIISDSENALSKLAASLISAVFIVEFGY